MMMRRSRIRNNFGEKWIDGNEVSERIQAYFKDFEHANNMYDPALLDPLVNDPLVGAYPSGDVHAVKKEDYLAGTRESGEYLQSLGYKYFKLAPVKEISIKMVFTITHDAPIQMMQDQGFLTAE